ncbi:MAG: acyloxyacyl hydrolase [Phycisphaerales bacterium]
MSTTLRHHAPHRPAPAHITRAATAIAIAAIGSAHAHAAPTNAITAPPLLLGIATAAQPSPETTSETSANDPTIDPSANAAHPDARFGDKHQQWLSLSGGAAFGGDFDAVGQLGYHYFLADSFEIALVLGGWYHEEESAGSASLSAHFRYHFINRDDWTLYAMAGAGVMVSSDEVPEDGTEFNFLPTVGAGATLRLGDTSARLDLGVRWHHISNANISSSGSNPDRDAIMVYAGVMFPF